MKSAVLVSVAALALWGATAPASAATYRLTIDDFQDVDTGQSGNSIHALFTTNTSGTITGISGTLMGGQGLEAVGGLSTLYYAPSYYNSAADFAVDFSTDSFDYEFGIAAAGDHLSLLEHSYLTGSEASEGVTGTVTLVAAVPLPPTLPMMGAALVAIGAFGLALKRSGKSVVSA